MFRVLLVDDEPLILSGIKFMVDWAKLDCELVGTARNGQQALEFIPHFQPDIIISDIKMPVMDGLTLLQEVNKHYPQIVFLVLSNHQEFHLAQQALRYQALDYITKSNLDENLLHASLALATKESATRKKQLQATLANEFDLRQQTAAQKQAALQFLSSKPLSQEATAVLQQDMIHDNYAVMILRFSPAEIEKNTSLFSWESDLTEKLAQNFFSDFFFVEQENLSLIHLFLWGKSLEHMTHHAHEFYLRLTSASQNITNLSPTIFLTPSFCGLESREDCRMQIRMLFSHAYLYGGRELYAQDLKLQLPVKLSVPGLVYRMQTHINNRNTNDCTLPITQIRQKIQETPHEQWQALALCQELYAVATKSLLSESTPWLLEESVRLHEIDNLLFRKDVLQWLETFGEELTKAVQSSTHQNHQLIQNAKTYTLENIDKKLSLNDVANHVNMSPSYFSSFFKKETGQNFIQFSNTTKIEKACEYLQSGQYRINEIALMLGFENAYYFSKVFRRHQGMSPSQFQNKHHKKGNV